VDLVRGVGRHKVSQVIGYEVAALTEVETVWHPIGA
jgi:hypothetical protein